MKANRKQSINLLVAITISLLVAAGVASSAMAKDKDP
jgi:hypothetical protein